ncbi:MAG: 50S ribosomal protein L10 [Desulfarculaceae bacterium]|nr:50S ribosomal protein L10 [Desulfarculaceae bacterium]MCF8066808.1 50S ribosomal protein L10 [Desulfarculaceae bacterium]
MNREQKEAVVSQVSERLSRARAVVLTDFRGLKVEQMTELRHQLREKGLDYLVVKNTLLRLAASGTPTEALLEGLEGPNGMAVGYDDPVDLAKVLTEFAKTNPKFEVRKGLLEGTVIDTAQVEALSKLPSREVLLAQLLGTMNAVPQGMVTVMAGIVRSLLNVLKAIEDQKAEAA